MLTKARLRQVTDRLLEVPGVAAVMLGGSRARGAEKPDSDVDLGLYYRPPLGVDKLQALAYALATARPDQASPQVTRPGEWGPWVDGGAWLSIDGMAVDWIYRDLDRVQRSWEAAQVGTFDFHFQIGHPLGVPDFAYAAEVALGVILADPDGELAALQEQASAYPPNLARAVVARLDEARFILGAVEKSAGRGDVTLVAGSLFRVVGLCAHAVHASAGRWVITEEGLVEATGWLPEAPPDFAARAHATLGRLGTDPAELGSTVRAARTLLEDTAGCSAR